jgi:hypothetical protein
VKRSRPGVSGNLLRQRFLPPVPAVSKVLGTAPPLAVHGSVSQEGESARDHDVSGMAPPSHIMRAQRSRIAANMSNMAALIFKNICRRQ